MSTDVHGRGRHAPAIISIFHDRLSRLASSTREPHAWQGFEVEEGILSDGTVKQVLMLGPQLADKRADELSTAIPLAEGKLSPKIAEDGKVYHASFSGGKDRPLELVRGPKEGVVTRIFRTGLIRSKHAKTVRGARQRDLYKLRQAGIKLHAHGIFPLELGSALVKATGETKEVMAIANVFDLTDPKTRRLKGIDVPESREMGAEIPVGGAVICADLGVLTITERPTSSPNLDVIDVTNDQEMWALFRRYVEEELQRQQNLEKALAAAAAK